MQKREQLQLALKNKDVELQKREQLKLALKNMWAQWTTTKKKGHLQQTESKLKRSDRKQDV